MWEEGETVFEALRREFKEEVNLELAGAEPLMLIDHDYTDRKVCLDFWFCRDFSGEVEGLEGQDAKWVDIRDLVNYSFPKANQAIIEKLLNQFCSQSSFS